MGDDLPAVLTRSPVVVGHITAPTGFTLVLLIFPRLRCSPKESLTGVATDPPVVHVCHGQIPAHLTVINRLREPVFHCFDLVDQDSIRIFRVFLD